MRAPAKLVDEGPHESRSQQGDLREERPGQAGVPPLELVTDGVRRGAGTPLRITSAKYSPLVRRSSHNSSGTTTAVRMRNIVPNDGNSPPPHRRTSGSISSATNNGPRDRAASRSRASPRRPQGPATVSGPTRAAPGPPTRRLAPPRGNRCRIRPRRTGPCVVVHFANRHWARRVVLAAPCRQSPFGAIVPGRSPPRFRDRSAIPSRVAKGTPPPPARSAPASPPTSTIADAPKARRTRSRTAGCAGVLDFATSGGANEPPQFIHVGGEFGVLTRPIDLVTVRARSASVSGTVVTS